MLFLRESNKGLFSEPIFAYAKRLVFVCTKIIDSCFEKEELYVTDKEIKFDT